MTGRARSEQHARLHAERAKRALPDELREALHLELKVGDRVEGRVPLRLPEFNAVHGRSLFLETGQGVVALRATPTSGHSVLEHQLEQQGIAAGDEIEITSIEWRARRDGERRYRLEEVRRP